MLLSMIGLFQLNKKLSDFDCTGIIQGKNRIRIVEWKNVDRIVWVFQGLSSHFQVFEDKHPNPHIVVIHDPEKKEAFEDFAKGLGISVDSL